MFSTSVFLMYSSGVWFEKSLVKGVIIKWSTPKLLKISAFSLMVLIIFRSWFSGSIIILGCGKKVKITLSPLSALALATNCLMIFWWPKCTPSKVPMVTTALSSFWKSERLWYIFNGNVLWLWVLHEGWKRYTPILHRGFSEQPDPLRSLGACPNYYLYFNVMHGVLLHRPLNRQFVAE